jgi:hypothetical protein
MDRPCSAIALFEAHALNCQYFIYAYVDEDELVHSGLHIIVIWAPIKGRKRFFSDK